MRRSEKMKNSTTDDFFVEQKTKSKIKTLIVSEFFKAYYSILDNAKQLEKGFNYIDLFSGPGVYDDGSNSTPAVLLDIIDKSQTDIVEKIQMVFNDEKPEFYESLKNVVEKHNVYPRMRKKPVIFNKAANEVNLVKFISNELPTFSFIDPWGYKDVSAEQIKWLVRAVGSDCILFFNVNRILQDLPKSTSKTHMEKIFGEKYLEACSLVENKCISQYQKGKVFVKLFSDNLYNQEFRDLKAKGYRLFVLPFEFKQDENNKTSHYILFISKNHTAIREMKKIMVKISNSNTPELSYDDKNTLTFSLFSRDDDVKHNIIILITEMLKNHKKLLSVPKSIYEWYELIDSYYMKINYIVTPYTFKEFQESIEAMDENGMICIHSEIKRKRITQKSVISFNLNVLEN